MAKTKETQIGLPTTHPDIGERPLPSDYQRIINLSRTKILLRKIDRDIIESAHVSPEIAVHLAAAVGKTDSASAYAPDISENRTVENSIHLIKMYRLLGDEEQAQILLRKLSDEPYPGRPVSTFAREVVSDYPEEAEKIKDRLTRYDPERGLLAVSLEQREEAKGVAQELLGLDNSGFTLKAAQILTALGNTDEAVSLFNQVVATFRKTTVKGREIWHVPYGANSELVDFAIDLAPVRPDIAQSIGQTLFASYHSNKEGSIWNMRITAALPNQYTEEKIRLLNEFFARPNLIIKYHEGVVALCQAVSQTHPELSIQAIESLLGGSKDKKKYPKEAAEIAINLAPFILDQLHIAAKPETAEMINEMMTQVREDSIHDPEVLIALGSIVDCTNQPITNNTVTNAYLLTGYIQSHTKEEGVQMGQQFLNDVLSQNTIQSDDLPEAKAAIKRLLDALAKEDPDNSAEFLREKRNSISHPLYPTLLHAYLDTNSNQAIGFVASALKDPGKHISAAEYVALCDALCDHKGRFTSILKKYTHNPNNAATIQVILQRNFLQFNQLMETLAELDPWRTELPSSDSQELKTFFEAIDAFGGTITSGLYRQYSAKDPSERSAYVEGIKRSLAQLFYNQEVAPDNPARDNLADLILLGYHPGLTRSNIEATLNNLGFYSGEEDYTKHLDPYAFPREGYKLVFQAVAHEIQDGEKLDRGSLMKWRQLLLNNSYTPNDGVLGVFRRIISGRDMPDSQYGQLLPLLLAPLGKFDKVGELAKNFGTITDADAFQFLTKLQEYSTVFMKDHFEEYKEFMRQIISKSVDDLQRRKYQTLVDSLTLEQIQMLLEPLSGRNGRIQSELDKFHDVTTRDTDEHTYRAIPSKNVASFFAKAAVDICTAEDISLYTNPNHFHINLIRDEPEGKKFMGNVQAYIIEVNGEKSLMLRGFNPTHEWMESLSVEAFSEAIIRVGKQFVEENQTQLPGGLYLSDPLGAWHALSNRQAIQNYLIAQSVNPSREQLLTDELTIGNGRTIDKVYLVSK